MPCAPAGGSDWGGEGWERGVGREKERGRSARQKVRVREDGPLEGGGRVSTRVMKQVEMLMRTSGVQCQVIVSHLSCPTGDLF